MEQKNPYFAAQYAHKHYFKNRNFKSDFFNLKMMLANLTKCTIVHTVYGVNNGNVKLHCNVRKLYVYNCTHCVRRG